MMLYFHDPEKRTVMCAPEKPTVIKREGKGREPGIWVVTAVIEETSAHNYLKQNGQWAFPLRHHPKEEYIASRDTEDEAIQWFIASNYPMTHQVELPIYEKFRMQYDAEARSNKPQS